MEAPRRIPDLYFFLITIVLVGFGLIMVYSASAILAQERYQDPYLFLKRQLIWALLGIFSMFGVMNVECQKYRKWVLPFLGVSFFLLLVLFLPLAGRTNEARRWLHFGFLSFQPSEMVKIAIILYLADTLSQKGKLKGNSFKKIVVPLIILVGIFGLIVMQPDYGTAATIVLVGLLLFYVARVKLSHFLYLVLLFLPGLFYLIYKVPYRWNRILTFLHPGRDPQGSGYQIAQSLIAIGSGGFFGLGLGEGRQKLFYLPQAHNDFIFSIIGEELGFVGAVVVVLLFLWLIFRGIKIALSSNDLFACLVAMGVTALFGIQAAINMGVSVGLLPTKGIPLPFVSAGGSSLFFNLVGVGMLLSISRNCSYTPSVSVGSIKNSELKTLKFRYRRRKLRRKSGR